MKELLEHVLLPYNLPVSAAMGLMLLYWLIVLVGGVAMDAIDIDLDADVDADLDTDGGNVFQGMLGGTLRFFNADAVPLTIILSLVVLFTWAGQILSNYYLNEDRSAWLGFLLMLVSFVVAAVLTKVVTQPLRPLMMRLKAAENAEPVVGARGVVRSLTLSDRIGQVEVLRKKAAPAVLTCRLAQGEPELPRGTEVVVLSYDEASGTYLVAPLFE